MIFSQWYACANPYKPTFDFLETCFEHVFLEKNRRGNKNTVEKQQFTKTNKAVDGLISSLENSNALMEFKGKYFDGDTQVQ